MSRTAKAVLLIALASGNVALAQKLFGDDPVDKKGHCVGFTSCTIPCDAAHHFCICDVTGDCTVE